MIKHSLRIQLWLSGLFFCPFAGMGSEAPASVLDPSAQVEQVATGFRFTEGPAADAEGQVYFTDIPNHRIHRIDNTGRVSVYREDSGGANGLMFDARGQLWVCEGLRGRLTSTDRTGKVTIRAAGYSNKPLNRPNDLWIDGKGGVYFTDPMYGKGELSQDGEHVYYLPPEGGKVIRVVDDMIRPNGLIGTPDGKRLYISDHGAKKTWSYRIGSDGGLGDKQLLAGVGSDGMTLDERGNVYLTEAAVLIYSPTGKRLHRIEIPERPANVCFGGPDHRSLYVTARTGVYRLRMRVAGASPATPVKGE